MTVRAPLSKKMRYLVKARVKAGKEQALLKAIEDGSLGRGSVAGDEYVWNMQQARLAHDGTAHWVEVCFCQTPLEEERPYWEEYFDFVSIKDAHARGNCRDLNGTEHWGMLRVRLHSPPRRKASNQGRTIPRSSS
jgi:hypothetical protein